MKREEYGKPESVHAKQRERETDPGRQVFSETGVVKTDAEDERMTNTGRKERR